MNLRADSFIEGLGPVLPETEGRDVVDVGARRPAVAQVRLADQGKAQPAELLRRIAAVGRAAVLHAVHNGIVIRARARLAAEIDVMRVAARSIVQKAVGKVVTAVNGPEIAHADREPAARAGNESRHQETALARFFLQGMVEERSVEQRDFSQYEDA